MKSQSATYAVSPARTAAFDILMRVERENGYASELLHCARYSSLSAADHALATEIVMGVLRSRSHLDAVIAAASSRPFHKVDAEVLQALRMAAYQHFYLGRIPPHAAINESVGLVKRARKKSAASFANAVLRKIFKSDFQLPSRPGDKAAELARTSSHPPWLVDRWLAQFGPTKTAAICLYNQQPPPTALRLRDPAAEQELREAGLTLIPGALLCWARVVQSGNVTRSAAFQQGRVVIQDEASQLVAVLVGRGSRILDCCCAPGGKTSILADQNPVSPIIAVELHPHRALLTRKLVSQKNIRIICADARQMPLSSHFDRVLADVPCSGTGTLARNPEIKWRLQPKDLADLQARQLSILESAMKKVTPGGRLVYSSCSLEHEENADVVERALAANQDFRLIDVRSELEHLRNRGDLILPDLSSLIDGPYLRTLPGIHPCDGFFVAILERLGG